LKAVTTNCIEIASLKKSRTDRKRGKPSYLANGRYSERKSPPFGTRRSRSHTPDYHHSFNLSTQESNNADNSRNRKKNKYDEFKVSELVDPQSGKKKNKVFNKIQIDDGLDLVEGS